MSLRMPYPNPRLRPEFRRVNWRTVGAVLPSRELFSGWILNDPFSVEALALRSGLQWLDRIQQQSLKLDPQLIHRNRPCRE